MKFTHYLARIHDVSIYPICSLLTFVVFFVAVTVWAWAKSKQTISRLENLPFEDSLSKKIIVDEKN